MIQMTLNYPLVMLLQAKAANALSISSPFTVFSFIYLQESKVI